MKVVSLLSLKLLVLFFLLSGDLSRGLVWESSVDHHFSSVGTIEDLVKAGVIEDRSNGCYTKTDIPMHCINDWQGNLWTSEVAEHMAKGNYMNGTTIYVNEFMALGHVPYDLQMLEVLRISPKVNRIILQRAPCEHPTLCLGINPWDSWFKGFFKAAALAFQPNITVYRRSYKSEPTWTGERWGSLDSENYTLKTSFNMLCFERVIRRTNTGAFFGGISQRTVDMFRQQAYSNSNFSYINNTIADTRYVPIQITIAHRGNRTSRHLVNYHQLEGALLSRFNRSIVSVKVVDTTDKTQINKFEDQVKIAGKSDILIAEHGAFQSNLMFMKPKSLLIDLRGSYDNPAITTFANLAEIFNIYMKHVYASEMTDHQQQSFKITQGETDEVINLCKTYMYDKGVKNFMNGKFGNLNDTTDGSNIDSGSNSSSSKYSSSVYVFPPKYQNEKCMITTKSTDGFGHQVEGKLTCLLLEQLEPSIVYVHSKMYQFAHGVSKYNKEDFFNFSGISIVLDNLKSKYVDRGIEFQRLNRTDRLKVYHVPEGHAGMNRDEWLKKVAKGEEKCDSHTVYELDNCWAVSYRPPYVERLPTARNDLRTAYFNAPKPDVRLVPHVYNVALHVRRGDAGLYICPTEYFIGAMQYASINMMKLDGPKPFVFWIESDEADWPGHQFIRNYFKANENITVMLPNKSEDVFTAFHRMVVSDGLILSQSSLSNSAALISDTKYALVPTYDDGSARHDLYESSRYIRVNEAPKIQGSPS